MCALHTDYMSRYEGKTGVITNNTPAYGAFEVFGFWWIDRALEPVDPRVCIPKPTWRIIIEGDENTSCTKYIVGKKVIKEVSAKRYHKDAHDPGMAAAALIGKMFPHTAEKPEPPKYFTGKAVCVRPSKYTDLVKGKIYDFSLNDGRGDNRLGGTVLCSPAKDIKEINRRTDSEFIEIKED